MYPRVGEKRRIDDINIEDEEAIGSLCRLSGRPVSPKSAMEQEKRMRREIANSNERRRMQSINAGFASLKTLLPLHEGEKLSKAAILQQTADYIYSLEQEKTRLLSQYCQIKRLLNQHHHSDTEGSPSGGDSPNTDERSLYSSSPSDTLNTQLPASAPSKNFELAADELRKEMRETRTQLEKERRARKKLEDHITFLETKIYPEREEMVLMDGSLEIKEEDIASPSCVDTTTSLEVVHNKPMAVAVVETNDKIPEVIVQPSIAKTVNVNSRISSSFCTTNASSSLRPLSGTQTYLSPSTIVTVLPSSKALNKTISPLLELRRVSDVETSHVTSSDSEALLIVPNNSCQNSPLDTICEAIRHLEGDNMFAPEDQPPRLEEEVVTEETFTIEEESHKNISQNLHHSTTTSIVSAYDAQLVQSNANGGGTPALYQTHVSHPINGGMGLTLHMIQPEPQEVPLELTTTHRGCNTTTPYTNDSSSSTVVLTHSTRPGASANDEVCFAPASQVGSISTHSSRPGVIVVKQP